MAKKVLNLSGGRSGATKPAPASEASSSASSASGSDDEREAPARVSEQSGTDDESESEDEEFEIPPGFEAVQGSSTITRESILSGDKELWFFKLPKNVDASALANVSFKVGKEAASAGAVVSSVKHGGKSYNLQTEDVLLTQQLVNAFPQAKERKKFTLGKPFTRCFSLVEDRQELKRAAPVEEDAAVAEPTPTKKSKSSKKHDKDAESKPAKKVKTKK